MTGPKHWTSTAGEVVKPCDICGIPCPHWKERSRKDALIKELVKNIKDNHTIIYCMEPKCRRCAVIAKAEKEIQ